MPLLKTEIKNIGEIKIENILHDSSSLLKSSYNFNTQQLTLTFVKSGGVYLYNAVPINIYESFKSADSIQNNSPGKYFHANIRNKYTTTQKPSISNDEVSLLREEINNLKEQLNG